MYYTYNFPFATDIEKKFCASTPHFDVFCINKFLQEFQKLHSVAITFLLRLKFISLKCLKHIF